MKYQLYRHFDECGRLLYVGVGLSAITRLRAHEKGSGWFDAITTITVEKCASEQDALDKERKAIREEKPLHNIQHVPKPRKVNPNKNRTAPCSGQWATVAYFADQWRVSEQRVRQWANEGRIKGAKKPGRDWVIPASAKRPKKLRNGAKA